VLRSVASRQRRGEDRCASRVVGHAGRLLPACFQVPADRAAVPARLGAGKGSLASSHSRWRKVAREAAGRRVACRRPGHQGCRHCQGYTHSCSWPDASVSDLPTNQRVRPHGDIGPRSAHRSTRLYGRPDCGSAHMPV
jgi:hypothetical protein